MTIDDNRWQLIEVMVILSEALEALFQMKFQVKIISIAIDTTNIGDKNQKQA